MTEALKGGRVHLALLFEREVSHDGEGVAEFTVVGACHMVLTQEQRAFLEARLAYNPQGLSCGPLCQLVPSFPKEYQQLETKCSKHTSL